MADKKDTHKEFAVCFENGPCAEMMRKMADQQVVGSFFTGMMKRIADCQKDGFGFDCSEIMRPMTAGHGGTQADPEKGTQ